MTSYKFAVFKYDEYDFNRYYYDSLNTGFRNNTNILVYSAKDVSTNTIVDLGPVKNFPYNYETNDFPVNRNDTVYRYFKMITKEKDSKTYIVIHRGDLEETWICCPEEQYQSNVKAVYTAQQSGKKLRTETVNIIEPKKYKLTINGKSYIGSRFNLKTPTMNSTIDLNQGNKLKLTYKSGKTKIIDYETNLE